MDEGKEKLLQEEHITNEGPINTDTDVICGRDGNYVNVILASSEKNDSAVMATSEEKDDLMLDHSEGNNTAMLACMEGKDDYIWLASNENKDDDVMTASNERKYDDDMLVINEENDNVMLARREKNDDSIILDSSDENDDGVMLASVESKDNDVMLASVDSKDNDVMCACSDMKDYCVLLPNTEGNDSGVMVIDNEKKDNDLVLACYKGNGDGVRMASYEGVNNDTIMLANSEGEDNVMSARSEYKENDVMAADSEGEDNDLMLACGGERDVDALAGAEDDDDVTLSTTEEDDEARSEITRVVTPATGADPSDRPITVSKHKKKAAADKSKAAKRRKKQQDKVNKQIAKATPRDKNNPSKFAKSVQELKSRQAGYEDPTLSIINADLTCSVCLELFYQPHSCEPCNHNFCDPCLRKLASRMTEGVHCPLCRTIIQCCTYNKDLDGDCAHSFPEVYYIRDRVEKHSKTRHIPHPFTPVPPLSERLLRHLATSRDSQSAAFSHVQLDYLYRIVRLLVCAVLGMGLSLLFVYLYIYTDTSSNSDVVRVTNRAFITMILGAVVAFGFHKILPDDVFHIHHH